MAISGDTQVRRASGVVGTDVADQHVLLNDDLRYVGLDAVGRRVWDLLEEPHTVDGLVEELTERYDVTPEQCRADVLPFLETLHEKRLVELG